MWLAARSRTVLVLPVDNPSTLTNRQTLHMNALRVTDHEGQLAPVQDDNIIQEGISPGEKPADIRCTPPHHHQPQTHTCQHAIASVKSHLCLQT